MLSVYLFYIFVSRSFPLSSAFLSTDIERGKVFGLNTLHRRKILPETACRQTLRLPPKPRVTFASVHREQVAGGMNLSYTIGCCLCHKRKIM